MVKSFCYLAILLLSWVITAKADDWNLPISTPQLQISTPLETKSIAVNISRKKIKLNYSILNNTEQNLFYKMLFSTPLYSWRGMSDNNPDRSYSDLVVKSNGQVVDYKRKAEIFIGTKNVSELFMKYNIDPNIISNDRLFPANTPETRKFFAELINNNFFNPDLLKDSDKLFPDWSTKNSYSWLQQFPAKSEQLLEYEYEPLWGALLTKEFNSNIYYTIPGFSWSKVEEYYGKSIEHTETPTEDGKGFYLKTEGEPRSYVAYWLNIPLNDLSGSVPINKISIQADIADEQGQQPLVFLTYGEISVVQLKHAEINIKNVNGTDMLSILILTPINNNS